MEKVSLIYVSNFTAKTNVRFDLLAAPDLKRFFIQLEPLEKSINRYFNDPEEFNESRFERIYMAENYKGFYESPEVVTVEDIKDYLDTIYYDLEDQQFVFPYEIFDVIQTPYPVETTEVSDAVVVLDDKHKNYLVDLDELNMLLGGDAEPSPAFVKAAIQYEIFRKGDTFFCELGAVRLILKRLGQDDLIRLFNARIFMYPTPDADNSVDLQLKPLDGIPFAYGMFNIYERRGFGMNRFFFQTEELAELLHVPNFDDENPFSYAAYEIGEFFNTNDKRSYCRLDCTGRIVHSYLAHIWNGHNETNDRIQLGWDFLNWFAEFLPDFYKSHGVDWDSCYDRSYETFWDEHEPAQHKYVECVTRKDLVAELAKRFDVDKESLIKFLLDERLKQFDVEQSELWEELSNDERDD